MREYAAWERVERIMKVLREMGDTAEPTRTEQFGTRGLALAVGMLAEALEAYRDARDD